MAEPVCSRRDLTLKRLLPRQVAGNFFVQELPKVDAWLDPVAALDTTTLGMRAEWFR
jgi:hypothetical protein